MRFLDFLFGYKPTRAMDVGEIRGGEVTYSPPESVGPIVAKVLAMLEAEDYEYRYSSDHIYTFAREEALWLTLTKRSFRITFEGAYDRLEPDFTLLVSGRTVDLNGAEVAALKAFFARQKQAQDAKADEDHKAALAKIEAYQVVNRKTAP
jgi:hypothetical protein